MAVLEELPLEVLALCFLPLSLRDRVLASHVCQRWRTAAIAAPALWSALKFNHRPERREVFLAILKRSGAGALKATWTFQCSVQCGSDVLAANMWRVKTLCFNQDAPQYYSLPDPDELIPESLRISGAPMLEALHVDLQGCFTIPALWDDGGSPRLRDISVNAFAFDPNCRRFSALRRFRGRLANSEFDHFRSMLVGREGGFKSAHGIFRLCPQLVELELVGLALDAVPFLPRGPMPRTLERMVFSQCWTRIDYGPFLDSLMGLPHVLALPNAVDYCPALRLYSIYAGDPFTMTCRTVHSHPEDAFMCPDAYSTVAGPYATKQDIYSIHLYTSSYALTSTISNIPAALDGVPCMKPYLHSLGTLECPAEFLDRLLRLQTTLPALQSLTIAVSGARPFGDLNYCHFQRSGHAVAPQLRTLSVDTTDMNASFAGYAQGWFLRTLPHTLPAWLRLGLPKLAAVHLFLSENLVSPAAAVSPDALLPVAETVFIGWRDGWEHGTEGRGNWYPNAPA